MKSKAISPMIAVVLLIAFTVAVGGIMSLWLTGYATTTTSSVETATVNQTKCAGTYVDVISVTSNAVLITNRGSEIINSTSCYTGGGETIPEDGGGFGTLTPGASNSTSWTRGANTSILCTGSCLNMGVTGECESGQSCWK